MSTDTFDQWTARHGIPHGKYGVAGNKGNEGKVVYLATDVLNFREKFRVANGNIGRTVEELVARADRRYPRRRSRHRLVWRPTRPKAYSTLISSSWGAGGHRSSWWSRPCALATGRPCRC